MRAFALSEWIDATDEREEALDAADSCDAGAAACCVSRCADEELAVAAMPLVALEAERAAMPWEVRAEDVDAAQLLRCSSDYGDDDADDVAAMPPAAAVRRLAELRLAHPLVAVGAGVLFFAAQVVALGCGVAAAVAADGPPADLDDAYARCARMCSLLLSGVTILVGSAVLRCELRACVKPPTLRPALLVSAVAGAGVIAYTLIFTGTLPGMQGLEVTVSVLTAAASIMVRNMSCVPNGSALFALRLTRCWCFRQLFFWNWVRWSALSELYDAADAEADEADAPPDDIAAAKLAAKLAA